MPEETSVNGNSTETIKYRLVFIPDAEYEELKGYIPKDRLQVYEHLRNISVENFSLGNMNVIFIPDKHKTFVRVKASSGLPL